MSLWAWIAEFPVPPVAIPATAATDTGDGTKPSQLSQGVGGEATGQGRPELSQPSQQSQPFGDAELHDSEAAREAFEERAAIMEFDGGMTRAEAERLAAAEFRHQYARAREAREPPTSDADRASGLSAQGARTRAHGREDSTAAGLPPAPFWPFEVWGDLRPCLLCQSLSPGGRCLAAWRGELRAARDYSPTFPGQPQRCIGYRPKADDPDRTPGRERWPDMIAWQAVANAT